MIEPLILFSDIVDGLIRSTAFLAHGSALFHASQTELGHRLDVKMTDLLAYVAYQAFVEDLTAESYVIHELNDVQRSYTANNATLLVQSYFNNEPVENWTELMLGLDIPELRITMCGFIETLLTLAYPDEFVDNFAQFVIDHFAGYEPTTYTPPISVKPDYVDTYLRIPAFPSSFSQEMKDFCLDTFLLEIRNATETITISEAQTAELQGKINAILIEFLYAAVWQVQCIYDIRTMHY